MNIIEFFLEMIQFLVIIPAAVICYLPMKNQLKLSKFKIFLYIAGISCVFIPTVTELHILVGCDPNAMIFPLLILFFIFYQFTLKTDCFRSFAVFIFSCVLSTFPADFAYTFDAWLHPDGTSAQFSWQAALFQLALMSAITILIGIPLWKWGSKLIDTINIPNVWGAIISVSIVFLLLNIAIIPRNYSTLYVGRCFPLYIAILIVTFMLLVFLYIALYRIAMGILENAKLMEKVQFFEMQESQYAAQKRYIEETSKHRHDFRQSIFTLKQLADDGNFTDLKSYLEEYTRTFPQSEIKKYCNNNAVNALLNYYAHSANANNIRLDWKMNIPDLLPVTEPDLCTLLGNLIENALSGCMTVSEKENRYHCLSVTLKNNVNLYIVSTNSFNGVVRLKHDSYISTKRSGNGIGIRSMKMIAEKYHGIARFSHTQDEFYGDIMLKMPKE